MQSTTHLRAFHQAAWNEPLLHQQTSPGERGPPFDPADDKPYRHPQFYRTSRGVRVY